MDQISVDLSGVTKSFDADEIRLEGARVSAPGLHVAPEDRNVGFVFQSCALWPHMNLRGNVLFPAETRGAGTAEARGIADRHLRAVDLTAFADRHPAALSGGQRQRVALRGGGRAGRADGRTAGQSRPASARPDGGRDRPDSQRVRVTTLYIIDDHREAMALADRIAAGSVMAETPSFGITNFTCAPCSLLRIGRKSTTKP